MLGKLRENSAEARLLQALRRDDDRETRAWLGDLYGRSYIRNAVSTLSPEEALSLIARGGNARIAAVAEHSDGHVREAALRALTPDPSASLSALLRRTNGWVPTVARLAGDRALALLPQADDETLVSVLPLVVALTRQGRADHGALVTAYLHETRTRRGLARRVRRAYRSGPVGEWASWRVVGDEETTHDLAQERLREGTPRLQLETARRMADAPEAWRDLLTSRNPQVRRLALEHAPTTAIEAALDDENAGVRNDARYLLGKRDYAEAYRRSLPAPGAVSGLGETGSREDAEALRSLLLHPKAEIRRRAIEALFRLIEDDAEPELRSALADPSRKVQRAAVEALVVSRASFDPETVLGTELSPAMRLRLLQRAPRWASLIAVLRRVPSLPGAATWLDAWWKEAGYGRIAPKEGEAREALRAPEEAQTALPAATQRGLREVLAIWVR